MDSFPKSFYAQRAKLLIADAYFKKADEGNLILAASEYREFINLYPYSPSAAYCQYQIGMTFFNKVLKPGRDQSKRPRPWPNSRRPRPRTRRATRPRPRRKKSRTARNGWPSISFSIGHQYLGSHAYKAATSRLAEILTVYPNFSGMDRVYFALGEAHFLGQKTAEAVPYFTKLVSDYAKSPLAGKAEERLKEIKRCPRPSRWPLEPPVAK